MTGIRADPAPARASLAHHSGAVLTFGALGATPIAMLIYKILTAEQWARLDSTGAFEGAPIDLADGYIHTSTAEQAQETAAKHFAGQSDLIVAALDSDSYGDDLVWEVSRGGAEFPHIYNRPLLRSEVVWHKPIPLVAGVPQVPLS